MWIQSLGWEDPLEKEMKTHSSILTWLIPQTEEPGGLMSTGSQKSQTDLAAKQQDDDQASKDNLLLVLISIYSN